MIGFYDSGIGGLTILNEVLKVSPTLDTFYYADSKHCPLGEKPIEEIQLHVVNAVKYLFNNDCELVVLACNTATAASIRYIQQVWLPINYPNKNVLGVIRPVIIELLEESVDNTSEVVILATKATVESKFYTDDLSTFNFNNVKEISMGNLAYYIENKMINEAHMEIDNIFNSNINTLSKAKAVVLACTHYPYEKDYISSKLSTINPNNPIILSQSTIVAEQLVKYLIRHSQYCKYQDIHKYYDNK